MNSKIAVYAGTFDPITKGHQDIAARAVKICDRLHIAVAENTSGKDTMFSVEERVALIKEAVEYLGPNVEVGSFDGLLVEHAQSVGAQLIIRGLRAVSDYEYEAQMALMNRQLAKHIETVFLMTSQRCSFISSSIVREVAKYGGDVSALVPEGVALRFKEMNQGR